MQKYNKNKNIITKNNHKNGQNSHNDITRTEILIVYFFMYKKAKL